MGGPADVLIRNKERSEMKSYLIGVERGIAWAENSRDYFRIREWSELSHEEFDDLVLPDLEKPLFMLMCIETPLDWRAYLKGWLEGVKEIRHSY